MSPSMVDLVRRPSAFFAAVDRRPSLVGPALVAAVVGATGIVRLLVTVRAFGDVLGAFSGNPVVYAVGGATVSAPGRLVAAALGTVANYAVGWVLAALVVYAVGRYFGAVSSARRVLALVGWGMVPMVAAAIVTSAVIVSLVLSAPDLTSEAAVESWARSEFRTDPVRQAGQLVSAACAFWTAGLWYLGARHGLALSVRRAVACVALPAGLMVLSGVAAVASVALT
jgi:hypothetical protein